MLRRLVPASLVAAFVVAALGPSDPGSHAGRDTAPNAVDPTSAGEAPYRAQFASAALLSDGTVLVAGGHVGGKHGASAARFDPRDGRWQKLPALPGARAVAATATLPGGDVLIAGGMGAPAPLRSAVIFDAGRDSWRTTASMQRARFYATASTLADGRVLVDGAAAEAETYDPHTGRWTLAGIPSVPTQLAAAATLPNGDVLVAGGYSSRGALSQVDRFDAKTNRWAPQRALPQARADAATAVLTGGRVLVAGGLAQHRAHADAFVYSADGAAVPARRYDASALFTRPSSGWPVWACLLLAAGIAALVGLVLLLRRRRSAAVTG